MRIAIDLDNTITASIESTAFFRMLTNLPIPESEICIITNRDESHRADTENELSALGIRYDKLALTDRKAEYIRANGINILFEDTDEYFLELGKDVTVFKIREEGNFDFEVERKWIGSHKTTKMIG